MAGPIAGIKSKVLQDGQPPWA
jgi:hypothetical protein